MSIILTQEAHESAHKWSSAFATNKDRCPCQKAKVLFIIFPKCSFYRDQNP